MALPHYEAPPIAEVVCGFLFDPVPGLDPLTIGWYALDVREDYPAHRIVPALADGGRLQLGLPIRAWLVGHDEAFLVQVQQDRFYLNWRSRGSAYPHFKDHAGAPGILTKAMKEFDRFRTFCRAHLEHEIVVKQTELAKIDHLVRGRHWESRSDLIALLPMLRPVSELAGSDDAAITVHFTRPTGKGQLDLSLTMREEAGEERAVLDSRSVAPSAMGESIEDAMRLHNDAINDLFERAIPSERRDTLFRGGSE